MQRFIFRLLILTFAILPSLYGAALALDIKNVRFGVHPDKTRLVIDLSEKTTFRSFILPSSSEKPYRLVVDMPDFNWQAGAIPKPPKTTVLDVRSGTLKPDIKRLVVDLEKPTQLINAFLLPKASGKPDRLVIDFKTITAGKFALVKRKIWGTLKESTTNLNLPITKQATTKIELPSTALSKNGVVIPPKKPTAPKVFQQSNIKAKPYTPLRKPLIVIDAGHGGADPGALGAGRLKEKNITLAAAKELKKQLEATGRYRAALTRSNDKYLKLYKRVSIARVQEADLFISLHADSIDQSKVSGASIYTLSNKASDKQTARLAARENQVDLIAGVDLSHEDKDVANILIDLAMRDTMNQSKFFANTVVTQMRAQRIRILEKPHRYAGFAVLKAPDIPSVLIEMGFMSNKKEARLLATKAHQRKMASALTKSIDIYFKKVKKNGI